MPPSFTTVQPFSLDPILVERIWGVDSLQPWHPGQPSQPVGEIWLTAESCRVSHGNAQGQSLEELTASCPEALGDPGRNGFPLLIKLLFPREKLSVQVHPDDRQAQALGMPRGKTECWYVLSAEPGAQVAVGFNEALSTDEVRAAIVDGTLESRLRMLPVKAGDMIFVDAGTVHAIGPGMVVLETQQYSDTTYRLWDYGRPRELHLEAGTAVTRTDTRAGLVVPAAMDGFTRLVSCEYFNVDRFELGASVAAVELGSKGKLQILVPLGEGCEVFGADDTSPLPLRRGRATVLPAGDTDFRVAASQPAGLIRIVQP